MPPSRISSAPMTLTVTPAAPRIHAGNGGNPLAPSPMALTRATTPTKSTLAPRLVSRCAYGLSPGLSPGPPVTNRAAGAQDARQLRIGFHTSQATDVGQLESTLPSRSSRSNLYPAPMNASPG